jgi:hypothetical protein
MAENPSEHPAVVTPKQVLANRQVVTNNLALLPSITSANEASTGNTASKRNDEEKILDRLYGDNKMKNVHVMPYNENPVERIAKENFNAWTNSSKLIYYNFIEDKKNKDINIEAAKIAKLVILYHEGQHIIQFRNNENRPPQNFVEMLNFEVEADQKTSDWCATQLAAILTRQATAENNVLYDFDLDNVLEVKQYVVERSKVTLEVLRNSNKRLIGQIAYRVKSFFLKLLPGFKLSQAPDDLSYEDIVLTNMKEGNIMLPSGDYSIGELYLPD